MWWESRKASLIVVLLVLFGTLHIILTILPVNIVATTLYVGGFGPNNYTAIQDAIDDSNPGDTVFVFGGVYNEDLSVNRTISLIGENRDTTIINGSGTGEVIWVSADWVNISGFAIINGGAGPPPHIDAGIMLWGVQHCYIGNNNVSSNNYGFYVYDMHNSTIADNIVSWNAGKGLYLQYSDNNHILDNTLSSNGDDDIMIYRSESNVVNDNWISTTGRASIALMSATKVSISRNIMLNGGITVWGGNLEEFNTHTIDTTNSINAKPVYYWKNVTGGSAPPDTGQIILANCTGVRVENLSLNNTAMAIQLGFSTGIVIISNTLPDNNVGIYTSHSRVNHLANNTIMGNIDGMFLYESLDNTITNNTVSGEQNGIYLDHSDGNQIFDNDASSNGWSGIQVSYSYDNVVANNTANSNGWRGVSFVKSDLNTIKNNTLSDNGHGIWFFYSNWNTIVDNIVARSVVIGLNTYEAQNNSIYHNNVLYNARQTFNFEMSNQWDEGYPSGGNYWSDYVGVDNCSGPNQDICPDPDGIGDTPYPIDSVGMDRYPLMSPTSESLFRPPSDLQAVLSGLDLQNVTLTWTLSRDDGAGFKSVTGYEVYRNSSYEENGLGYALHASLANGTSQFVDVLAGDRNPNNYFYRVCAVGLNNGTSCSWAQAGKFTDLLSKGTSLISVPLVQSNESIERVLQTVKFDMAWTYNATDQTDPWKSYMVSKSYRGELRSINHRMGVWINVTEQCNYTVAGIVPLVTDILLDPGWNMVGYPSFSSTYRVSHLKAETYSWRAEGFDPANAPYHLKVLSDDDILQAGHGYWVFSRTSTTWRVQDS